VSEFDVQTGVFSSSDTRALSGRTTKKAGTRKRAGARATAVAQPQVAKRVESTVKKVASKKVASKNRLAKGARQPDIAVPTREGTETFAIEVKVGKRTGEVIVTVLATEGEHRQPVAEEIVRRGLERLLQRESRLERTAARYGLATEALLASLEESAVDVTDESAGMPEAERHALHAAGIHLEGSMSDPSGAAQIALGLARYQKFRDEALTAVEAARLLRVSDSRVRQLVSSGQVVTIPNSDGHLLPAWQFAHGRLVPGLSDLTKAVNDVHPLTLASFMTLPDVDLEVEGRPVSPVEWLISGGEVEAVTDLALGLAIPS